MLMKLFATLLAGVFAWSPFAQAQTPASVKLYIFDCGHLKSGNPDVLTARGVTTTDMSVAAYLIVHPRGTLLSPSVRKTIIRRRVGAFLRTCSAQARASPGFVVATSTAMRGSWSSTIFRSAG